MPYDPYEILRTGITSAVGPMLANSDRQVANSRADMVSARERMNTLADTQNQRAYQDQRENQLHSRTRSEAEDDRLRALDDQIAAQLPPGETMPANLDEMGKHSLLSKLTRDNQIKDTLENNKNALNWQIEKTNALSENEVRQAARDLQIPEADQIPLGTLRTLVAQRNHDDKQEMDTRNRNAGIDMVNADTRLWPGIKARLDYLNSEEMMITAKIVMPEPELIPGLKPGDDQKIYATIAKMPDIQGLMAGMKNGPAALEALAKGDEQGAMKLLKPSDQSNIGNLLSQKYQTLGDNLQRTYQGQYSQGMKAYVERLRTLPYALSKNSSAREALLKHVTGLGQDWVNAYLAVDPNDSLAESAKNGTMDRVAYESSRYPMGGMSDMGTDTTPLPQDGTTVPGQPGASIPAGSHQVEGLFPWIGNKLAQGGRDASFYLNDPVLQSGLGDIANSTDAALRTAGNMYRTVKSGLFTGGPVPNELSGHVPGVADSPMDLVGGVLKTAISPVNMAGRFTQDLTGQTHDNRADLAAPQ